MEYGIDVDRVKYTKFVIFWIWARTFMKLFMVAGEILKENQGADI